MPFLLFIWGCAIGSFLAAWSYRLPREIPISKGRSHCPNCGYTIAWYDNIPLLSYILLKGSCRNCKKHISARYPLIEFSTGIIFVLVYLLQNNLAANIGVAEFLVLPLSLFVASLLVAAFTVDIETQIIPDTVVFLLLIASFFSLVFSNNPNFWVSLASGFSVSLFLLFLHAITRGRGMGLGDVKLVLPLGFLLGFPGTLVFLFLSFLLGAAIGVILIAFSVKGLKSKIAFGPFLVIGFALAAFFGNHLVSIMLPFS